MRLGEPIHTVVPHNLMDKLLNHQYINPDAARERHDFAADVQEYDYLFYLSAVIAGIQLATVSQITLLSTSRFTDHTVLQIVPG